MENTLNLISSGTTKNLWGCTTLMIIITVLKQIPYVSVFFVIVTRILRPITNRILFHLIIGGTHKQEQFSMMLNKISRFIKYKAVD